MLGGGLFCFVILGVEDYLYLTRSIVFYGANFAPRFTRGMYAMIGVSIAMAIWCALVLWVQKRDEKRRETEPVMDAVAENDQKLSSLQGHKSEDIKV